MLMAIRETTFILDVLFPCTPKRIKDKKEWGIHCASATLCDLYLWMLVGREGKRAFNYKPIVHRFVLFFPCVLAILFIKLACIVMIRDGGLKFLWIWEWERTFLCMLLSAGGCFMWLIDNRAKDERGSFINKAGPYCRILTEDMLLYFEIHFFFFFTPFSSLRAKQAFSPCVCAEMYISETSRHVFHSEKGSLHAGKRNRRIEGMASHVCECATSEWMRDVRMKPSFKTHLRGVSCRLAVIHCALVAYKRTTISLWLYTCLGCIIENGKQRTQCTRQRKQKGGKQSCSLYISLTSEMRPLCRRIMYVLHNAV